MVGHAMKYYTHERNIVTLCISMGFQMNIRKTYLNNMNILLLHVNICFATETMKSTKVQTLGVMAAVYANAPLIDGLDMRMRIFSSDKNGRLRISRTTEGVLDLCNGAVSEKTPHIF